MNSPVSCSCGCGQEIPAKHLFRYREPYVLRGHQQVMPPCECGCGEPVKWFANSRYTKPRFIKGHERRSTKQTALCACGCGRLTTVYHGRVSRFISGHNSKGMKRGEGRYINAHGYVLLRMPGHPRAASMGGYVMEHRYLVEQHIGRYLEPDEHVHHLNHDRSDNRIENLMIIDPVEHAKYHTSQPRRAQSDERRQKAAASMSRVWAERRAGLRAMPDHHH